MWPKDICEYLNPIADMETRENGSEEAKEIVKYDEDILHMLCQLLSKFVG